MQVKGNDTQPNAVMPLHKTAKAVHAHAHKSAKSPKPAGTQDATVVTLSSAALVASATSAAK